MILANPVAVPFWASAWPLALLGVGAEVLALQAWFRRRCTAPADLGFALLMMHGFTWPVFALAVETTHAATGLSFLLCNAVFEVLVVIAEAGLIRELTRNRFFVRHYPGRPFTWWQALLASLFGNGVSIVVSLLAIGGFALLMKR